MAASLYGNPVQCVVCQGRMQDSVEWGRKIQEDFDKRENETETNTLECQVGRTLRRPCPGPGSTIVTKQTQWFQCQFWMRQGLAFGTLILTQVPTSPAYPQASAWAS